MKKSSVILSLILVFVFLFGILNIFKEVVFPQKSHNEDLRSHMNTGNTIRIKERNLDFLGTEIAKILYPGVNEESKPQGLILVQSQNWQEIIALIPLMGKYKSPIIPIGEKIGQDILEEIKRLSPKGIPQANNIQIMVFGSDIEDLQSELINLDYNIDYLNYENLMDLQNKIYSFPGFLDGEEYGFIVQSSNPFKSIPIITWIANNKGMLIFADDDGYVNELDKAFISSNKIKKLYLIGDVRNFDTSTINNNIEIERIEAVNPERLAIKFAEFYDGDMNVGWDASRERNDSGHNFILCSKDDPQVAAVSTQLAFSGKTGPLLWTSSDKLSPLTENYLWKMKNNFWVTPAEGPFNNVWIIGDESLINFGIQARVDYTQEIESYEMMGEQGVGGLDVLSIISILISIGGALWISFHLFLRMKEIFILTKIMWILTALLLGPIGLWLYVISHKDRPWMKMNNNKIWQRPLWNQTAVATIMGVAFGACAMISAAYIISSMGMFLIPFSGGYGFFLFGNPMILQMIIVYIIGFILNSMVFMPAMLMRMRKLSYIEAFKNSVPTVLISMTSVSIGMMISMWWLHMVYSPMMPEENHVLWWGFMQLATLIGAAIAYIPNWFLVRYGRKMGVS